MNNFKIIVSKEDCIPKCKVPTCKNKARSLGYCSKHYNRIHKYGRIDLIRGSTDGICSFPGCKNHIKAKGLCSTHLARLYRNGSTKLKEKKGKNIIDIKEDYAILHVQDKEFIIDINDIERVSRYTWYFAHKNDLRYASAHIRPYGTVTLHRFIINEYKCIDKNIVCDHMDGNIYNNRKNNLRLVSNSINLLNRETKGYYKTKNNKYQVQIRVDNKRINLGTYESEDKAKEIFNNYKNNIIK